MLRIPVIALFVLTCAYNTTHAQVTIQGNIKPHPEWRNMVYLFYFPDYNRIGDGVGTFLIDSAMVHTDGSFTYGPKGYKKGIYRLSIPPVGQSNVWFNPRGRNSNYLNLVVTQHAENIQISGQADSLLLSFRFLNPSPDNALVQQGVETFKPVYHTFNSLAAEVEEVARLVDTAAALAFYASKQQDFFKELMTTCDSVRVLAAKSSHVLGALTILRYAYIDSYLANAAYWDEELVRFEKLDPNNLYLNQIRNALERERGVLSIGSTAPDIALPSPKGDSLKLSDVKKRLTIIDFWASWCGPCIMESKTTIKPLHEKWAGKGLEVFAVSVDKSKEAWHNAMEKHGYERWLNTWDAKGGVYGLYDFTAIPTIFLIDENMNIVAKNLRGQALINFVENYLGK